MALLLKDREASPQPGGQPPDGVVSTTAPDFACEVCGAAMERGQDWCLECGTAAPGRLGARPGWRAAFTVVGLTTLLLVCAVVAAYAALTSDAERSASTAPVGSADPITAQTPGAAAPATPGATPAQPGAIPVQPGATGPNTTAPPAVANPNPIIPARPLPPATNTPVTPVTPPPPRAAAPSESGASGQTGSTGATGSTGSTGRTGSGGSDGSGGSGGSSGSTSTDKPGAELIALRKDAAKTYNQPARAGAEFGPAANAVDGKPSTVWDVVVPADGQPIGAGLVIDLGKPYALRSLRLATSTPGFTVEIYGAKSAKELPADVIDKRWIHLTDKKGVTDGGLITLKGKGDGVKVELLLLHITDAAEPTDPRVAIGDVTLRGSP